MQNIWIYLFLYVFFIGITFINYSITQTKIFKVKVGKERTKKSNGDYNFKTEGVAGKVDLGLFSG